MFLLTKRFTNLLHTSISVHENNQFVTDINATDLNGDSVIFSLSGGSDFSKFDINATSGIIHFINPPDYEANSSARGTNYFEIEVTAYDGELNSDILIPIFLLDVLKTTHPFQSDGNLSIAENTTFVFEFNATDPDGHALTYSIPYGDDHTLFEINATTGILSLILPKDYESPEDNNTDNIYELTVEV